MTRLEIRFFGGFDVRYGDQSVSGFESQKVRALFAYLAVLRDRSQSRDQLTGLLWSEFDEESARRSLRQALYNLRAAFQRAGCEQCPVVTSRQSAQFSPEGEYWFDLAAFDQSRSKGMLGRGPERLHHLAGAVELYRGDLLQGFSVRDAPEFEDWLHLRQSSYRDAAADSMRLLINHCLEHQEYQVGIRYARRLLELEPLSEPIHAILIRLYSMSGQRGEAINQFDLCRRLLDTELGVAPSEETLALYRLVLAQKPLEEAKTWEMEPFLPQRPVLPFVGRQSELGQLIRLWQQRRSGQLVLLEGEAGVGKTSLAQRLLREISPDGQPLVISSHWAPMATTWGYEPLTEALRRALIEQPLRVQETIGRLDAEQLTDLARLLPELYNLRPDLPQPSALPDAELRGRCLEHLTEFLCTLVRSWRESGGGPLVLFLDDLQHAEPLTFEALFRVLETLRGEPIWVLAARRTNAPPYPALNQFLAHTESRHWLQRMTLERLPATVQEQMAESLLGRQHAQELSAFLARHSCGLPRLSFELIQLLYEESILAKKGERGWHLVTSLPELPTAEAQVMQEIAVRRLQRLPTSARRLLTLAAVVGKKFHPRLLLQAADEQAEVVLANVAIWLKQQLVVRSRQGQYSDLPDDARPELHESFEFPDSALRDAIYEYVSPERRRVMHREVAEALEKLHQSDAAGTSEALAYHFSRAEHWGPALTYLERSAAQARHALLNDRARRCYQRALEALAHLEATAATDDERAELKQRRSILEAARSKISGSSAIS